MRNAEAELLREALYSASTKIVDAAFVYQIVSSPPCTQGVSSQWCCEKRENIERLHMKHLTKHCGNNLDIPVDIRMYVCTYSVVPRIKMKKVTFMYVWNIFEGYNI